MFTWEFLLMALWGLSQCTLSFLSQLSVTSVNTRLNILTFYSLSLHYYLTSKNLVFFSIAATVILQKCKSCHFTTLLKTLQWFHMHIKSSPNYKPCKPSIIWPHVQFNFISLIITIHHPPPPLPLTPHSFIILLAIPKCTMLFRSTDEWSKCA